MKKQTISMPKRTYVLTGKQKKEAMKLYKKGYTTHGKLSKKLGVSRQKVSNWLKAQKIGKRVASPFWSDVKAVKKALGVGHTEATYITKTSSKWVNKRWFRMAAWRRRLATAPVGRGEKGGYSPKETIQKRFMEARDLHTQNEFRAAWEAHES